MSTLYLNLASAQHHIAMVDEQVVRASHVAENRITEHSLIPILTEVLRAAKVDQSEVKRIACIVGPGGFTSLRVGITFANVLADQLQIPMSGIHLSDLYAARTQEDDYIWLHSTKKDSLFIRGFGMYKKQWPEPTLIVVDDVPDDLPWVGELLHAHQEKMQTEQLQLQEVETILPSLLSTQKYTSKPLLPWYGRSW